MRGQEEITWSSYASYSELCQARLWLNKDILYCIHGSASESYHKILDPIRHHGLYICLGAISTTPVKVYRQILMNPRFFFAILLWKSCLSCSFSSSASIPMSQNLSLHVTFHLQSSTGRASSPPWFLQQLL